MVTDIRVHKNQLQVAIGSVKVWALVDSGANISVISSELAARVRSHSLCLGSEAPDFKKIKGVGGEIHEVTEKLTFEFRINSLLLQHSFHVINGHHNVILGIDFLKENSAVVDFGLGQLAIKGLTVQLGHPAIRSCLAKTVSTVHIPARYEGDIPVKCTKSYCNTTLLFKTTLQSQFGNITVSPTLVNISGSQTMCHVINNSDEKVTLPAQFKLAHGSTVVDSDVVQRPTSEFTDVAPVDVRSTKQLSDIAFQIDNPHLTGSEVVELQQFLKTNRHVFAADKSELGKCSIVAHHIDTRDATPVAKRFYRTSPEKRAEIDRQVEEGLQLGWIETSTSEWRSPVVLVKKADGSWRMCCDYRQLNAVTRPQFFPLPRLEDVWDAIGDNKATVYSVLDLSNGFHQLRMDPDSVHKTAFVTQNGQFQWRVLPYGLTNSPVTFMRTMHDVLRPYLFKSCIVYVDDIIVFSRDMKEHLRHLRQVFQCLNKAGLKLKPSKCRFAAVEVKYLGHILSREGIRPNPEKTAIIDSFPTPTDVKQVRSFLGLANYYKRFVKDFSVIAAPLFKLLRKDVSFVWDEACVQAFNIIRNKLVQEPILKFPDMSRPFLLTTDASNTGIGYVLSQKDDTGREPAVAYGGRALRGPETRYSTTEQEYLAIKEGIQAYHPYLADKPFTVYTDHKPLKYAAKFRPDMGRLGRWALFLQSYNFATEYKAGKTNLNADTLSRVPFPEIQETSTSQNEQKVPGVASADSLSGCAIHDSIELCSVDPVDMAQMQRRCSDVKPLYQFHSSQTLPQDNSLANVICRTQDQYIIDEDGVLFHIYFPSNRRRAELMVKQLVVPKVQRRGLIVKHHDDLLGGGHQGIDRTYASLLLRAFWPGMYASVRDYVNSCEVCQKVKHHRKKPALLTTMPIASVFQRWHMDFLCMRQTPDGYKYILLLVDSFSRWCEAIPTKTQDAATVAQVLYRDIFTRYGTPDEIVSDLGRQFTSRLVRAICELGGVRQKFTSPYHPQTNATCERLNSFIIQSVKAYCDADQNNWPDKLPGILMAYRSTPATRSTEFSPYQLVFGRTMSTPADVDVIPKKSLPATFQGHLNEVVANLKVFQEVARDNVAKNQSRYKQVHDRKAKDQSFQVGHKVLMTDPAVPVGLVPKLYPPYKGPFTVMDCGPSNTYRLMDGNGKLLTSLIHFNRLFPFTERQVPPGTDDQEQPEEPPVDPPPPDNFPPDPGEDAGEDSQDDLDDSSTPRSTQDNDVGTDSHINSQTTATQQTHSDVVPTSQSQTTASTNRDIIGIQKAVKQQGKEYYKVIIKDETYRPWLLKADVPEGLVELFHKTRTRRGTVRKHKRQRTFFTKQ